MSNIPSTSNLPSNHDNILPYSNAPRYNNLARLSMILGIIAVPTVILFIGVPLGLAALILGIISQARIAKNPLLGGKGMASWGVTLGTMAGLIMPLLIAILIPSLSRQRNSAPRASCSANLQGIMESLLLYAAEQVTGGGGPFPSAKAPSIAGTYSITRQNSALANLSNGKTSVPAAIDDIISGSMMQGSPTAGLWMLVLRGQTSPKNYICRWDDKFATTPAVQQAPGGTFYEDFGATNISYAIAYPWTNSVTPTPGPWYKDTTDSTCPYLSDMPPAQGLVVSSGLVADVTKASTSGTDPHSYNSPNHNGDGQNVAYGDVHVEWHNSPICGSTGPDGVDNIFTTSRFLGKPDPIGIAPSPGAAVNNPGLAAPYDVQMVPARNGLSEF